LQLPTLLLPRLLTLAAAAAAHPNPSTFSVCTVGREETLRSTPPPPPPAMDPKEEVICGCFKSNFFLIMG